MNFRVKNLNLENFTRDPPGRTPPSSSHHPPGITHRAMQHSFENLFLPIRKETMNTEISVQKKLGEEM